MKLGDARAACGDTDKSVLEGREGKPVGDIGLKGESDVVTFEGEGLVRGRSARRDGGVRDMRACFVG